MENLINAKTGNKLFITALSLITFCAWTIKRPDDIKKAEWLVFENPMHDFPQIISYTKITCDSLVAQISGEKNGQERKQAFPMKRVE